MNNNQLSFSQDKAGIQESPIKGRGRIYYHNPKKDELRASMQKFLYLRAEDEKTIEKIHNKIKCLA